MCLFFIFLNYKKVGLKNKSFYVPSTFFSLAWLISSLGIFLYSNGYIEDETHFYENAQKLEEISNYQFWLLITIFLAFIHARRKTRNLQFSIPEPFSLKTLPRVSSILKYALYVYFIVGMIRLIMVVSVVGFDYSAMRAFYLISREHGLDTNLIRLGSYLGPITSLYVCLLGMESAISGLSLKRIFIAFALYSPFRMSFGGRIFILSFFLSFLVSYFVIAAIENRKTKDKRKLLWLIATPIFLIVFLQILKMGETVNADSISDFSKEIFYTASSYRYMNELWEALPMDFSYGLGRHIVGLSSPMLDSIVQYWDHTHNSAAVCVPSMIPDLYLDFGRYFSLPIAYVIFYNMEKYAFFCMNNSTLKRFLVYIALCTSAFGTNNCALSFSIKSFIVSLVAINLVCKLLNEK